MKTTKLMFVLALALGSVALAENTVNARQENQQDRIANGVGSGQLTARETANLENKEAAVHSEVKADRAANGGHLTAGERGQVNHQQNKLSRNIYRDKHNARVR